MRRSGRENNARLISVMHHSLIDHSEMIKSNYTIRNSKEALKVFHKSGIEAVFTGHIHTGYKPMSFREKI